MSADLAPCPFCAAFDVEVEIFCEPPTTGCYWIFCMECEAEGPSADTLEEAKRLWNERFRLLAGVFVPCVWDGERFRGRAGPPPTEPLAEVPLEPPQGDAERS